MTLLHQQTDSTPGLFPMTMWSAVIGTGDADEVGALRALDRLARAYWRPLYVFVRQRGLVHEDASDAVQGFFAHLLSKEMLHRVERRETRFRTFLLHCFTNWLISAQRRETAAKRGGNNFHVPLAEFDSESGWIVARETDSPEVAFDRRWAHTIFQRAQERLGLEIASQERADYLRELHRRVFHPGADGPNWAEVAQRFGMSEGAVRKAALELRGRFAGLLRAEVLEVVSDPTEVDAELRYLFELLSSG